MFTIPETAVKELELFIQEIPFKYASPILQILNGKLVKSEEPQTPENEENNSKQ